MITSISTPVLYILLIFTLRNRCCGAVSMLVLSSNIIFIVLLAYQTIDVAMLVIVNTLIMGKTLECPSCSSLSFNKYT